MRDRHEGPRVAVVIPNWNSLSYLRDCLASLATGQPSHELLVVDNGSGDGSSEWLTEKQIPHIALPRNLGFAAAVNLGAASTNAPYLMVLNADATLEAGCLERLVDSMEQDAVLGGVQPCILQVPAPTAEHAAGTSSASDSKRIYSAGQALTRDGRGFELDAGLPLDDRHGGWYEAFGVCGAACLLRRELFTELGGYDERYFSFCEDVDLNVRARIAGWRFGVAGDAIAWHHGNATWQTGFKSPAAENARLVARNRLATQLKFMPIRSLPMITAVEVGSLFRAYRQNRFRATLKGKIEALRWLPQIRDERRRLSREGNPDSARDWLGRRPQL